MDVHTNTVISDWLAYPNKMALNTVIMPIEYGATGETDNNKPETCNR